MMNHNGETAEIETPLSGKIFNGGAARETLDGVALKVTDGGSSMRVPVTFLAKNCVMGGTVNRNRLVPATIAELGSNKLLGQSIDGNGRSSHKAG